MKINEKQELKTLHVNDLDEMLTQFGQFKEFHNGLSKCIVCDSIISNENIGSLQLKNQKLFFSCNKSACYNKLMENE